MSDRFGVQLSLCGLAMLAFAADRAGEATHNLYEAIPPHAHVDSWPGEIPEWPQWPHNISEWVDELQSVIDHGLIRRQLLSGCGYQYTPTAEGLVYLRAALHPRAYSQESVA